MRPEPQVAVRRIALSALPLVAALSLAPAMRTPAARAQEPTPTPSATPAPAPVRDRVAFFPAMTGWTRFGAEYGLKVQNLGAAPARFLVLAHSPDGPEVAEGCAACPAYVAQCSPVVAPGAAWPFFPAGGAAVVYSLSMAPAAGAGPAWAAFAAARGLPAEASVADAACAAIEAAAGPFRGAAPTPTSAPLASAAGLSSSPSFGGGPSQTPRRSGVWDRSGPADGGGREQAPDQSPTDLTCETYRTFHAAYLGGEPMGQVLTGLPLDALRGGPLAAAAAFEAPTVDERQAVTESQTALDREAAVSLAEAMGHPALAPGAEYEYVLPGVFVDTPEFQKGLVWIQNAGTGCVQVKVEAFRMTNARLPEEKTLALAPGATARFLAADVWTDHPSTASLRVTSDGPLAVMASQLGYRTSASFTAQLTDPVNPSWAIPLAYQEPKPAPGRLAAGGSLRTDRTLAPADGRRTQVAVFNAGRERDSVLVETQADGQEPRQVPLSVEPLTHITFELGFGLGDAGGEGWALFSSRLMPMVTAFYGYRLASDVPAMTETWAAPAWRYREEQVGRGPRVIGLPDLAARHEYWAQRAENGPAGRLALQNLSEGPTELSIDTYGRRCGYFGTRDLTLDGLQARIVAVDDLAGSEREPVSAVVRVRSGEAAVELEVARPAQVPVKDFPPDRSEALLGIPVAGSFPTPFAPPAALEVSPLRIELDRPRAPVVETVTTRDSLASGRCLSYRAISGAPWLTVINGDVGPVGGGIQVRLDPAQMPRGPLVGQLRVEARESFVQGHPVVVEIVIRDATPEPTPVVSPTPKLPSTIVQPQVYLPNLQDGLAP